MAIMLRLLFQTGRLNMGAALIVAMGLGLFALGAYAGLGALRQSQNWARTATAIGRSQGAIAARQEAWPLVSSRIES